MIGQETLMNFVGGHWEEAAGAQTIPVRNPATGEVLAAAPLSSATDVAKAVKAASTAWQAWRRTPAGDRIQPLFRLKALLDTHFSEIARLITQECGKTTAPVEITRLVRRELRIIGSYGARTRSDMPEIIRLAAQGIFRPETMVTQRFSLDEADAGYQALARGEIVGRAIVVP